MTDERSLFGTAAETHHRVRSSTRFLLRCSHADACPGSHA
jgi:hypothetical protein